MLLHDIDERPHHEDVIACEPVHHERPQRESPALSLVHAVVALVADDADDFTPSRPLRVSRMRLPSAALGSCQSSRARFSETIANRTLLVDVRPRELAPRDQRVAHRLQQAWRDELVRAQRRNLPSA